MADTVTSQILENGAKWLVMHFTNLSDGTGETNVKKIDVLDGIYGAFGSKLGPSLAIVGMDYDIGVMALEILWDLGAAPAVPGFILNGFGKKGFASVSGMKPPQGVGATGSIIFTTKAAVANATYEVTLKIRKNISFQSQASG